MLVPLPDDAPAAHRLLAQVAPLLRREAGRRHRGLGLELEDAYQSFAAALLRSAPRYDPTVGAATTFATVVVRCEAIRLWHRGERRVEALSLDVPFEDGGDAERSLQMYCVSREPDPLEAAGYADEIARVVAAVDALPESQRRAVRQGFGLEPGSPRKAKFEAALAVVKDSFPEESDE